LARKYGCDARDIDLSSSNIPEEPGTINDDVQGEISNDCDAYSISLIDDKISISLIDDKISISDKLLPVSTTTRERSLA
jgi:hypothetical protein